MSGKGDQSRGTRQSRGTTLGVTTREATVDTLRCDRSTAHDVRMEWEVRDGMRTGRLTAFCWTCKRQVPMRTTVAPPDTARYRDAHREAQRQKRRVG